MGKCPHVDCHSHTCYIRAPTRVPFISTNTNLDQMTDIIDGSAHSRARESEETRFITMTLNSDGVLVKQISRSLWITTMVINEIPRSLRFQLPNMIIGMISYGSQKPKRAEFSPLLNGIVDELVRLSSTDSSASFQHSVTTRIAVYLLGVVADKPTQSMIQNTIDSVGFYGCTNCHIVGESVPAGKGFIRCFPPNLTNLLEPRSNTSYDQNKKQRAGRNSLTSVHTDGAKGYVGPCLLRRLRFFDMGHSFLTDSLHNLYAGLFLKLLKIWLEPPSFRRNTTNSMSIFDRREQVEVAFDSIHFPTSTYRVPQRLRHFCQFKANELRLCLLMGYNCFRTALNCNQYKDLRALAFALHLAEAKCTLVRTLRDPSQPSTEICYNLELLHRSWIFLDHDNFLYSFKLFINQINSSSKQARPRFIKSSSSNIRFHQRIPSSLFVEKYLRNQEYELYRTVFYNGLRYSYKKLPNKSRTHDGCILYHDSYNTKNLRVGFFRCAIKLLNVEQDNVLLLIEQIKVTSIADIINIDNVLYQCTNVLEGHFCQSHQFIMIKPQQIKEKLVFWCS
ncbi:hypothetical protein I4U23_031547 [Adineta vaga]|nr:hypothetical protein I4U23_031547 [Adineta vaga]